MQDRRPVRVERIHILIRPLPKEADLNRIRALLLSFTDASMLGNWRFERFFQHYYFFKIFVIFSEVFCYGRHAGYEFYTTVTSGLDVCILNPPSMIHNFHKNRCQNTVFLKKYFSYFYIFFKIFVFFRIF